MRVHVDISVPQCTGMSGKVLHWDRNLVLQIHIIRWPKWRGQIINIRVLLYSECTVNEEDMILFTWCWKEQVSCPSVVRTNVIGAKIAYLGHNYESRRAAIRDLFNLPPVSFLSHFHISRQGRYHYTHHSVLCRCARFIEQTSLCPSVCFPGGSRDHVSCDRVHMESKMWALQSRQEVNGRKKGPIKALDTEINRTTAPIRSACQYGGWEDTRNNLGGFIINYLVEN